MKSNLHHLITDDEVEADYMYTDIDVDSHRYSKILWKKQQHYMHIHNYIYSFRAKTRSIFEKNAFYKYFDIFVLDDKNFD